MSVLNFADNPTILIVDTSTEVYLGSVNVANNQEIQYIVLDMYKKGSHATTEQFRLKLYTHEDRTTAVATSDTRDVSDITSMTSSGWKGRVRFDFNRQNLNVASTYYVTLDPVTYTRNSDTFYFSAVLDHPSAVNTNNTPQAAAKMEIWSYR